MEKLTREEIIQSVNYYLESAWVNKNEAVYYLMQLPMKKEADYDIEVHEYIKNLKNSTNNRTYYEMNIYGLIEHYYINQENYDF